MQCSMLFEGYLNTSPLIRAWLILITSETTRNNLCCSGCGLPLRGMCYTFLPWGKLWPAMRMIQTPGWSVISLWIMIMHWWAVKSPEIWHKGLLLFTCVILMHLFILYPVAFHSQPAGVSVPKSTLPWSVRRSSVRQTEIKRSAGTTSFVKSPMSPMVCVTVLAKADVSSHGAV